MCVPGPVLVVPALSYVLSVPAPCDLQMKHWIHHDLRERGRKTMIFTLLLSVHPKPLFSLPALSLTHTHTRPRTRPRPPMSLTCMLHSLDRHTVGNQNIITLSHTAANSGVAIIQNSRAALTLNFHMKLGATKYRPEGRNWPAGREFETPGLECVPLRWLNNLAMSGEKTRVLVGLLIRWSRQGVEPVLPHLRAHTLTREKNRRGAEIKRENKRAWAVTNRLHINFRGPSGQSPWAPCCSGQV